MQKIPEDDRIERSEAPVPWPAEEQEDNNPQLCPSKEKATRPLSRSRRRLRLCRVQDKGRRHFLCRFIRYAFPSLFLFQGSQPSTSTPPRRLPWWRSRSALFRFVSALLVWVRRRHPARRNRRSDACYVAISSVRACEESDGVAVATRRRRRASRIQGLITFCPLREEKRQALCRDLGRDIILVAFFL
ncbi:hypothetical protein Taro_048055 [Colocasia esculenta]|uniref:Uncharacterized protein n=1 Tax=Colocasia esculenta TaxID=4460 RepID=A0A843X7M3_COLES|nr:hypothetical protein [Colocasia esculenta]